MIGSPPAARDSATLGGTGARSEASPPKGGTPCTKVPPHSETKRFKSSATGTLDCPGLEIRWMGGPAAQRNETLQNQAQPGLLSVQDLRSVGWGGHAAQRNKTLQIKSNGTLDCPGLEIRWMGGPAAQRNETLQIKRNRDS